MPGGGKECTMTMPAINGVVVGVDEMNAYQRERFVATCNGLERARRAVSNAAADEGSHAKKKLKLATIEARVKSLRSDLDAAKAANDAVIARNAERNGLERARIIERNVMTMESNLERTANIERNVKTIERLEDERSTVGTRAVGGGTRTVHTIEDDLVIEHAKLAASLQRGGESLVNAESELPMDAETSEALRIFYANEHLPDGSIYYPAPGAPEPARGDHSDRNKYGSLSQKGHTVVEWLESVVSNFHTYTHVFASAGLDSLAKLRGLTSAQISELLVKLKSAEGSKPLHIRKMGRALQHLAAETE
jgi:hypothetical protein